MHCLQSSSLDKMCNCLFPDFPLCTDTTELCLHYYLLLLPVVGVLLSRLPSLVTPVSPDFGSQAVRIPSLLLRGEGSVSVGLEQRAARAGGTRQAAHTWLTSRRVICCLSHISLLLFILRRKPLLFRGWSQCSNCLSQGISPVLADQQEILPRTSPGCLAESICSFLPPPLLKQRVLSSHTPLRQQKNKPGVVGGERRMTNCSLTSVTASQYPWTFLSLQRSSWTPSLNSTSNPRRSFDLPELNQLQLWPPLGWIFSLQVIKISSSVSEICHCQEGK